MQKTQLFTHISRSALSLVLVVSSLAVTIAPTIRAEAPDPQALLQTEQTLYRVDGLTQQERAEKIDKFYRDHGNLPLAGYGFDMVVAADAYGLDWRLIAAIGFIESSGGRFMIKRTNNAWGWGGGTISFPSYEIAIDKITRHLAGLEPGTAKWYANKTLSDKIDAYNPPTVRHDYNEIVFSLMNKISNTDITPATPEVFAAK